MLLDLLRKLSLYLMIIPHNNDLCIIPVHLHKFSLSLPALELPAIIYIYNTRFDLHILAITCKDSYLTYNLYTKFDINVLDIQILTA